MGKAAELALGFAGGVMAFSKFSGGRLDMDPIYVSLCAKADPGVVDGAHESHDRWSPSGLLGTAEMSREAWVACEITKVSWRNRHPEIVALWQGLEDAAFRAVETPGSVERYGKISYFVHGGFLWCQLPSGRTLAYADPRISSRKTPWGDKKPCVTFSGVDSVTRQWVRKALYGGLATENVVQATARDLLVVGMIRAEQAGYPCVLTIHDESVAETPIGFGSLEEYEKVLCTLAPWAAGFPLTAEGYVATRFKK